MNAPPVMLLLLSCLSMAACVTSGTAIASADLASRVEQARTPADLANLAAFFEERAAAEERFAKDCHKLLGRYGKIVSVPGVRDHYASLMKNHRRNAEDYRALAQAYRRQAEQGSTGEDITE